MLQTELKKERSDFDKQVNLMISLPVLTGEEWELSHERMMWSVRGSQEEKFEDSSLPKLTEEQLKKKSKYAYIMLTYRIDDTHEESKIKPS